MHLVEALRPRLVVELGTYYGASYCSFCQAMARLGLAAEAFAVDTWEGDPHNGWYGDEIFRSLQAYHDSRYGAFSTLVRSSFSEARGRFSDESIDLLHIDGFHTYEAVRDDFESWLPKVSPGGIVLLHDTEERKADFGVWRFWEELQARFPTFSFQHGHGLGVLAKDCGHVPPRVRALFEMGEERRSLVLKLFARLGEGLQATTTVPILREELARLQSDLRKDRAELREQTRVIGELNTRLRALEGSAGYAVVQRLERIRSATCPPGSRREKASLSLIRAARALIKG